MKSLSTGGSGTELTRMSEFELAEDGSFTSSIEVDGSGMSFSLDLVPMGYSLVQWVGFHLAPKSV